MHDPLVEWGGAEESDESDNIDPREHAEYVLARVRAKLNGQGGSIDEVLQNWQGKRAGKNSVSVSSELPLTVNGQVHRLIEEATDKSNLASMYIWWMAWC